ncbi:MAG: xanthine dehydrogenase family protein molybdopterin-binding subunit [Geminicoccaceae bacterium]|nr:MAG: xanthine dehydrogenase family protein molybdopterin-binding subunit [Geminicoccaceae bacterium]
MSKFGTGQPVKRLEDVRFITGKGRYTDDINLADQLYGVVVRSPVAHGVIKSIDIAAALAAEGVHGVFTGAELAEANANRLPCVVPMTNRDGSERADPGRPVLAVDKVRFAGEGLAFVVAESVAAAKDAAELVAYDIEELPAVAESVQALASDVEVHEGVAQNRVFDWQYGEDAAVEAAFAQAAHTTELELINNRLVANPMETRSIVAAWDRAEGKLTAHVCSQGVWGIKDVLANHVLHVAPEKVRVLTSDVGGGFGMKIFFYPEYAMAAFAARRLGQSVKWTAERGEGFLSDAGGRDHVTKAEMAFDQDGVILGMRVHTIANMGAHLSHFAPFIPTGAALKVLTGVYDVKCVTYRVEGAFTNTAPIDAYRGAGRPESIYCIERLIEKAAREMGMDRTELRRKNFIPTEAMPFKTAVGEVYDSGAFATVMDRCMERADWAGFEGRRHGKPGKRRGIGMCYYIESTMGNPNESADVRFEDDGTVSVAVGTQSNGQGHETAYAQVLADKLGIPLEQIKLVQGDSDRIAAGGGTGGSRSLTAQGVAIRHASDAVIEKGKLYAAQELEVAKGDIRFEDGTFSVVGTDRSIGILELAAKARTMTVEGAEGGLDAAATITLDAWTFPNGCHIAEVEVDEATGVTEVVRYTIVDDFGVVVNPMLVAGQVHGGTVQGIGQALYEHTVYDETGQLTSGSFMDYTMPRADDVPLFDFSTFDGAPCQNNEMGVKGCGEAGSVGSCAAVINALIDALADQGITAIDMPATPEKVWAVMHGDAVKIAAE